MNITNLLDNIEIILKRKNNIESIIAISALELYEFELKGYPKSGEEKKIQFGDLNDSPKDSCGYIEVDKNVEFNKEKLSSCDPLLSPVKEGGEFVYNIQKFYQLYKKWKAKERFNINDDTYSTKEEIKDKIIGLMAHVNIINKEYIEKNKGSSDIPITDESKMNSGAMVYKINVKNNEKIVIFGDFHGSYHTFLRHMFRLYRAGIIANLVNYKLVTGYRLVFLGDILDRGEYALEILLFIMNLMYANNTKDELKVILNRGNHEELSIASRYGFRDEVRKKIDERMFDIFITMLSYCPSAIILENESEQKFWLSHGGVPFNKSNEAIKFEITDIDNKAIEFIEENNDNVALQIRWNDFSSRNGLNLSVRDGRDGTMFEIGPDKANDFMKLNNINFIIRGHQDNPDNSYLLSNNDRYVLGGVNNLGNNETVIKNIHEKTNEIDRNVIFGPIYRIDLTKNWNDGITIYNNIDEFTDKLYPIITLSTNTDLGRNLTHDSFGILRFDLSKTQLNDFSKETNIIDTRKDMKTISGFTT